MWKKLAGSVGILLLVWSAGAVFSFNLCDLVFDCGCESAWGAQADHCNIHTPGAKHCPWCTAKPPANYLIGAGFFLPSGFAAF